MKYSWQIAHEIFVELVHPVDEMEQLSNKKWYSEEEVRKAIEKCSVTRYEEVCIHHDICKHKFKKMLGIGDDK